MAKKKAAATIEPDGTIITRSKIEPRPGYPCPDCHGSGHNDDGTSAYIKQGDEVITKHRPSTPCRTCEGKGRVNISPIS